jgi:hypothetical protein
MLVQGTLQNDFTTSGQFMAMDEAGRLETVSSLIQKRARFAADLSQVEEKLRACNDSTELAAFAMWCIAKKKSFGPELKKKTQKLEARKSDLQKQMQQIDGELARQEPVAKFEVHATMASLLPGFGKICNPNPHLAARDIVIAKNIARKHEDICRILDSEFAVDGRVAPCLPDSWTQKFGVTTFLTAYRHPECRGLVHTMFSKQKKRMGLT